jgi:site-specific recombinase
LAARLASLSAVPEFRVRVKPHERFLLIDVTEYQSEAILNRSARVMDNVYQSLEGTGVSIELVFLLERMKGFLARLQLISNSLNNQSTAKDYLLFVCEIIKDQSQKNSILGFLSSNLNLLSKKITDRAGQTGEHYIARSAKEMRILFWSSAGGGVLTTFTSLIKSGLSNAGLPLFVEGFMTWINYSLSFMLIQVSHFTLATKTPAMTAPVLAEKLKEVRSTEKQLEFVREVKVLVRSGFFAILGNVIFVILSAVIVDLIFFQIQKVCGRFSILLFPDRNRN